MLERRLAELLARPRYEVIPLEGIEDAVLADEWGGQAVAGGGSHLDLSSVGLSFQDARTTGRTKARGVLWCRRHAGTSRHEKSAGTMPAPQRPCSPIAVQASSLQSPP